MRLMAQVLGVVLVLGAVQTTFAAGMRVLPGHVPAAVARLHLQAIGRLPATTRLNLAIGLPLRNEEMLTELLQQIYDPASTNYHRYLTPEQFTEKFGPDETNYQAVLHFAETNGLTVAKIYSNRLLVDVSGTASDIEKAFHVRLWSYQHPTQNRTFYAPDTEPSVDANIPMVDVSGLNNYVLPHPLLEKKALSQFSKASPAFGSGPSGSYMGNDFRAAYAPSVSLNGSGQIVGLLEFDGYYPGDIASYESQAGLPKVPLQNVLLDNFSGNPGSGNDEVALDIEMAISMAPQLSKVIVFEGGVGNDILNSMVANNQVKQFSSSWTWGGGPSTTTDNIFKQMATQGQSFFQASGDSDAYDSTIDRSSSVTTPVDNPYVTSVGGTTLTTSGAGDSWAAETVWNWGLYQGSYVGSGGGISTHYSIPDWQANVNMTANQGSTSYRNIPDVAMTADDIFIVADNGQQEFVGGTSCAAPLWAGFTALANQQAAAYNRQMVGFLNPAIYAIGAGTNYASDFHDIINGNNTNNISPTKFFAVSGYDLCTGWGTPAGQNLINDLAGPPDTLEIGPQIGFTASGPVGGPFNVTTQDFSLTNLGADSLDWSLNTTSLWLSVSSDNGTLAAGETAVTTVSLNTAADDLSAGIYTASVTFTNLTTGVAQSRQFILQVGQPLVQNGGFETGDFSDWTLNGDGPPFNTVVTNYYVTVSRRHGTTTNTNPDTVIFVHSGSYGAALGEPSASAYLSQTLPTVAGKSYLLSFWFTNPYTGDTPNEFLVSWEGNTLFDQSDLPELDWTNMQFIVTATSNGSVLEFGARNDPEAFGLDDISVTPVAIPALHAAPQVDNNFQFTWNAVTGLVYQIQYTTNLSSTNWINFGNSITASNGIVTLSDTNALISAPQRFYRLVVSPQ
jgi:Pro-kumamolisin, activation domain